MDVSLQNKPRKTKTKTSKGKVKFLQCRGQIFLMATHLFLFIHDVLYAHIRQHYGGPLLPT